MLRPLRVLNLEHFETYAVQMTVSRSKRLKGRYILLTFEGVVGVETTLKTKFILKRRWVNSNFSYILMLWQIAF